MTHRHHISPAVRKVLRARRHRRGLSVEDLAADLLVHPRTLKRWEQGESDPPCDAIDAWLLATEPQEGRDHAHA